jgi:hypothetical protein
MIYRAKTDSRSCNAHHLCCWGGGVAAAPWGAILFAVAAGVEGAKIGDWVRLPGEAILYRFRLDWKMARLGTAVDWKIVRLACSDRLKDRRIEKMQIAADCMYVVVVNTCYTAEPSKYWLHGHLH